jgi:hypothetical protein
MGSAAMNSKDKPNGHGALLAKGSRANGTAISLSGLDRAASVDASELPVANATASSAAAGAGREACADVAQAEDQGKRLRARTASPSRSNKSEKLAGSKKTAANLERKTQPGLAPLPIDGEAFVDAVHAQVDLVALEVDLLRSADDKLVQRELAYLRELRYGKHAPPAEDEPTQIIFDIPGPERDKQ